MNKAHLLAQNARSRPRASGKEGSRRESDAELSSRATASLNKESLRGNLPSPPTTPDTKNENPYRQDSQGSQRSLPWSLFPSGSANPAPGRPSVETPPGDVGSSSDTNNPTLAAPGQHRMIIAIDYGTTFTGIGYIVHDKSRLILSDIKVVDNWGTGMDNDVKVPSVISYSPCSEADEQQFGSSLSPEAVAMINTKLELDVQDTRLDELDLILQVLEGVKDLKFDNVKRAQGLPGYTWKAPQKIVADYLEKAFVHFKRATDYLAGIKNRIPVDVIITVPVQWSYRAKNSTFKAIREAGFNESAFPRLERYVMVTEPEAAALYTARYLKEMEDEDLRVKDCFILCDAGGGTVDVVAYKVKETSPGLELQQMTIPTGKKCGASFVDQTFRNWLYDQIGEDNYNELDPRSDSERISAHATEGGQMRLLMQAFDPHKKAFKGSSADMHIPLPEPLDTLNIPGIVEDGELLVTNDDMRSFFGECIDEVIELIQGQIAQVDKKNNRVKTIFLIGGFSESEYLQEELAYSLRLRKIRLRRPSTSWSAVVRGAVLYGMESTNRTDQTRMIPCPRNYGLVMNHSYSQRTHGAQEVVRNEFTNQAMVRSQFDWFLMKGDLLLPNDSRTIEKNVVCYFHENAPKVCTLRLYEYLDDDLPEQYENAQEEVTQVGKLVADLSHIGNAYFERQQNRETGHFYYEVSLIAKFTIAGTMLRCELWWQESVKAELFLENIDQITRYEAYHPAS